MPRPVRAVLSAEESATLRDQLIADLNRLQSSDEAADWVHKNLAVKNTLTAADADSVEASFRERVLTLEAGLAVAEGQRDHAKDDGVEPPGGQAFIEMMDASAAALIILPQKPVWPPPPLRRRKNDPASRQGTLPISHDPALRRVRPDAERSAPHSLRAAACARPQGQRRVHRSSLPAAPPRIAPLRRRGLLVGWGERRSAARRA